MFINKLSEFYNCCLKPSGSHLVHTHITYINTYIHTYMHTDRQIWRS